MSPVSVFLPGRSRTARKELIASAESAKRPKDESRDDLVNPVSVPGPTRRNGVIHI